MRSIRHRTWGVAVLTAGLALGTTACSGAAQPGVATAETGKGDSGSTAQAATEKSWDAYDKAMRELVACYREHGFPSAKYTGHKSTAHQESDEISNIPDLSKQLYPAVSACLSKDPKPGTRPEPYAKFTLSPQEVADLRKIAKCMRAAGLTDVKDPSNDPSQLMWGDGTEKAGQLTPDQVKHIQAETDCYRKLGITQPDTAGG
ncbi:MAG: hypothetical protein JWO79_4190 [Actinomycetia bacterium]|nr:hypothetical protein [Actinomycetes bacterium]